MPLWGERTRGRKEEKDKNYTGFSYFAIDNAAAKWENKASLQISLFVLQIPTFPTDRRPDEPLNAE